MPEVPALPRAGSLNQRVAGAFADDGPLASAVSDFEPRPSQRRLADAVATTFDAGGTLVAEAGTGTGKTLAYLVPAVLAGERVLISTGTRTLQDQIFYKDLPDLARALDLDVRAAYMKGRANYLCLHRFGRLREAEAGLTIPEREWLSRITEWAGATETGDRAEIDELPDDFPMWTELSSTSEQCLGRECGSYQDCFITKMRERANDASVVIVNHHLLCADASVRQSAFGEVIPECRLAVIDEAHQLEDVVTQYFGVAVSSYRIDEFARDATQAVGGLAPDDGKFAVGVTEAARDTALFGRTWLDLAKLELRQQSGGDRLVLTPETAAHLDTAAVRFREGLDRLVGLIRSRAEVREDLAAIATRALAMSEDVRVLMAADDPRFVHFVEARGKDVFVRAAPIDVAEIVRESVVGDRRATVLTSATLRVDTRFDYMLGRLGLVDASTLALPSEFDFESQALLYLPPEMPDPRSPDFNRRAAETVVEILEHTQGRAFVLFTSYAAMREVGEAIDGRMPWPILTQGTAPRSALLREFRATPNAVLLATSSFWQGVDVAGDALSCVIVDRLPFASPGDPLVAARIASVNARGGHGFRDYQVPLATLTLLQGLGRLIRTRSDRGVLAVLDPRLTCMPYGRRFLASLPPAPIVTSMTAVERFLRYTK